MIKESSRSYKVITVKTSQSFGNKSPLSFLGTFEVIGYETFLFWCTLFRWLTASHAKNNTYFPLNSIRCCGSPHKATLISSP